MESAAPCVCRATITWYVIQIRQTFGAIQTGSDDQICPLRVQFLQMCLQSHTGTAQTAFKTKYVCQNTLNACHMRMISMPRDRVPLRIKTHGYRILSKTVKPKSFIEECTLNAEHRQMYFGRHQCNVTPESCKAFLV